MKDTAIFAGNICNWLLCFPAKDKTQVLFLRAINLDGNASLLSTCKATSGILRPAVRRALDQMASRSPFQPQFFYGSTIVAATPNMGNYLASAKDTATSCSLSGKCYENVFPAPVPATQLSTGCSLRCGAARAHQEPAPQQPPWLSVP